MEQTTLEVDRLCASFFTPNGEVRAVNDVSLRVPEGSIAGIVGESGCGKSMTARAIMGLIKKPGRVVSGRVLLDGQDLLTLPERSRRKLRGSKISMIFQEPMTSLNPVLTVGRQVEEAVLLHTGLSGSEARKRAVEILTDVGVPDAADRCRCYPHQLSGGLRQRVMIAMAMVCKPRLLIADEPTTALDVTVEAQILRLMKRLCDEGTSILLISHNLGVIAQLCDRVYVMYAGRILEQADVFTLFSHPLHPYTRGLMNAVSSLRGGGGSLDTIPGVVPNLLHLPEGCAFSLRCAQCGEDCARLLPPLREAAPGHLVRCGLVP